MKGRAVAAKYKILWVGDAVAHTGFSTVTHGVLDRLQTTWDVSVLGINYLGDPHSYKYPIYPAAIGGDIFGQNRLPRLVKAIKPDVVCLLNDPWIVRDYISALKDVKSVAYMPVDSPNMRADFVRPLNDLSHVIAYTQFGLDELRKSGLTVDATIIPHGVELAEFKPVPRQQARLRLNIPDDFFIVGCVNRNQPRKRLDLAIRYFANWVQRYADNPNIRLYYHGALQDQGWDIIQLCEYYGIEQRLMLTSPNMTPAGGVKREVLNTIYNSFDVQISTTLGEGWGLTQMEGMACGIPQVVPEWSALAEWPRGAVEYIPCTSTQVNVGGVNTIGGIPDERQFIDTLDRLYHDEVYRKELGKRGFDLTHRPEYSWSSVAASFDSVLRKVVEHVDSDNTAE